MKKCGISGHKIVSVSRNITSILRLSVIKFVKISRLLELRNEAKYDIDFNVALRGLQLLTPQT